MNWLGLGLLALATLYAENGWIGQHLAAFGIKVAFTPLGIVVALIFVTLPFVIREVEPVLHELGTDQEEAAATLGSTWWQTFWRITLDEFVPAIEAGQTARAATLLDTTSDPPTPLQVEIRYNTGEVHNRLAVAVAAMWKEALGIKTTLYAEEFRALFASGEPIVAIMATGIVLRAVAPWLYAVGVLLLVMGGRKG